MTRPTFSGLSPTAFVGRAIEEGMSVRSFLKEFRAGGGKIGDRTAYSLFGEVRHAISQGNIVAGVRTDALPRDEQYAPWSTKRGQGFATALIYNRREVGTTDVGTGRFLHVTDRPHSPDEAIAALMDTMAEPDDVEEAYGFEVLGAAVAGLYRMKPFDL